MADEPQGTENVRDVTYEEIVSRHPQFEGIISRKNWEFVGHSDKRTVKFLRPLWKANIEKNFKKGLWDKHGPVQKDCMGLGKNKAVIAVGAGNSFNRNKNVLKRIADIDGVKDFKERDFIIIASNHMFKPLLNMGIIPDFTILADASDVVYNQLCVDIPDIGRNTILLAIPQCSHKVLKRWHKQGRPIRFYMSQNPDAADAFQEVTGEDPRKYSILQGGNVLNSAWSLSMMCLKSSVFMAVGNDLSFPVKDTVEERRDTYYCDRDYSSNAKGTGTGRDEAASMKKWLGFNISKSNLWMPGNSIGGRYHISLELRNTTHTLWVYKTWVEANVLAGISGKLAYHYYNCTEGGILGVMCKDDSDEGQKDESNWFMLDDVCKRYHTRTLEDAAKEFITAKECMKWGPQMAAETRLVVPPATAWAVAN
jgi:hypothetical protein